MCPERLHSCRTFSKEKGAARFPLAASKAGPPLRKGSKSGDQRLGLRPRSVYRHSMRSRDRLNTRFPPVSLFFSEYRAHCAPGGGGERRLGFADPWRLLSDGSAGFSFITSSAGCLLGLLGVCPAFRLLDERVWPVDPRQCARA